MVDCASVAFAEAEGATVIEEAAVKGILARATCAGLAAGLVSASAAAQTPAPEKPADRNQMICQKVETIGSRIASKRVCMTRAQWEDAQLQDRQAIERAQTQRGMKGE